MRLCCKTKKNTQISDNMLDIFGLEDNLPDELVSSGTSWADQFTPNKPPAQGPGPGNLNGEDPGVSSVVLQRQLQQQQQLQHLMQQVILI